MSKIVVITGASGGIGEALARRLSARGDRLVLAARRESELKRIATELPGEAVAVPTDVRRRGDVDALRDAALRAFGQVDAWINNAGRGIGRSVVDLTDDDVDEMMAVNVKSALYGIQAIVKHFQTRGEGHIVNVSSFLGRVPVASYRSMYSASKAALNSLTANLRMDLAASHPGIHVTLVLPGPVATEFHANALGGTPGFTPPPGGPLAMQSADDVAQVIAAALEHPVPEVYTQPSLAPIARAYADDLVAFERGMRERRG